MGAAELSSDRLSVDLTSTSGVTDYMTSTSANMTLVPAGSSSSFGRLHPRNHARLTREVSAGSNANSDSLLAPSGSSGNFITSGFQGFQRNGNEIRRSLRRINSLTRRRLSPALHRPSSAKASPSVRKKHSQSANKLDSDDEEEEDEVGKSAKLKALTQPLMVKKDGTKVET